jgi:hypothetical protein
MNSSCIKLVLLLLLFFAAFLPLPVRQSMALSLTDQELDELVAPIALYPDPALAELLPASTYPTEIAAVATWLESGGDPAKIEEQSWDESVSAIAHYPDILYLLADNMDWTADLGDAFLNQPDDITKSVQRLRKQARDIGNLVSNSEQSVIIDGDYIQIIPAQPQYIYIPQYDPDLIYAERWAPGLPPMMIFGLGLPVGGWLVMDFDWYHHHVIYHGWNRRGWVNNSRPYVHVTNVYISRSKPAINQTWRHDVSHAGPDRYWVAHGKNSSLSSRYPHIPEVRGREVKPPAGIFGPKVDSQPLSNRGRESRDTMMTGPALPQAPAVSPRPAAPAPRASGVLPPAQVSVPPARIPAANFGGYRGAAEARSQSIRGQTSRQISPETRPSSNRGGRVPETRLNAPAVKTPAERPAAEGRQGNEDRRGHAH